MPKSKKAQKKTTSAIKSGHPAKMAEQRASIKDYEKDKQRHIRQYKDKSKEKKTVPQNVGSMYQPPLTVEPLENYVPTYSPKKSGSVPRSKKNIVAKAVAWGIVVVVGGSLILTSLALPDPAVENILNQENTLVGDNSNSLEIGNPSLEVPSTTSEDPSTTKKKVAEFESQDVEKESEKKATKEESK